MSNAIGVGIPGTVDPERGTVRFAVNVGIGRDDIDLGARSDGRARRRRARRERRARRALGADWYLSTTTGAVKDLAYLSIGTGIAAGYVERGQLRRGNTLVAGEIGHIPIDPQGPLCACGQIGCIEAISSGSAIERMWPTETGASAAALHRAASGGDTAARRLWDGVIGGLSRAVLLLALTWDPEVIVLSGGVASLGDVLREAIADRLASDAQQSEFLGSLDLGARMRVIDPTVPLGPDRCCPRRARGAARSTTAMTSLAIRGGHGRHRPSTDRRSSHQSGRSEGHRDRPVVDATGCSVLPGFVDLQTQRRGRCRPHLATGTHRRGRRLPRGVRRHVVHADGDLVVRRRHRRTRSR